MITNPPLPPDTHPIADEIETINDIMAQLDDKYGDLKADEDDQSDFDNYSRYALSTLLGHIAIALNRLIRAMPD